MKEFMNILGMLRSSSSRSSGSLSLLEGEPQVGLVSRTPKFSENTDAIVSGLDDVKLLRLPYDPGWPSEGGLSSDWEPMQLLLGVRTSPGCQVADSGDECDTSPSFNSIYLDRARSEEKKSLETRDDGGAGIPVWP